MFAFPFSFTSSLRRSRRRSAFDDDADFRGCKQGRRKKERGTVSAAYEDMHKNV